MNATAFFDCRNVLTTFCGNANESQPLARQFQHNIFIAASVGALIRHSVRPIGNFRNDSHTIRLVGSLIWTHTAIILKKNLRKSLQPIINPRIAQQLDTKKINRTTYPTIPPWCRHFNYTRSLMKDGMFSLVSRLRLLAIVFPDGHRRLGE
jgi:hypothetical protein